jgi:threonine dehydrogenase-like Zn-dependent dehydrogenase
MGHEYSGTVIDKGQDVTEFEIGDRVTRCDAKIGPKDTVPNPARFSAKTLALGGALRNQAYAEYMAVDKDRVMKIPDSISDIEACSTEPLAFAVHSVRLSKNLLGDQILLIGAGPIGLFTLQCASLAGALKIFVSETNKARREMAYELGAYKAINPLEVNLVEEIEKQTRIGVDIAFECAGAKQALQQALEAVRISGRVIVQSLSWQQVDCVPVEWSGREIEMKTAYGTDPIDWQIAANLIADKKISIEPIISRIISLDDIQRNFQELLSSDTGLLQVVVSFSNDRSA